jgi:hypothetical protein
MEVESSMRYEQSESTALVSYSDNWLAAQTVKPLTEKQLDTELAVLATAFPTVVRGYDASEHKAMKALWHGIFRNIPQEVLREAILRFIINDRKGFFPAPGQIVGYVEQIAAEHKAERDRIAHEAHMTMLREIDRRIKAGENCSTCRFCEHRREKPSHHDKNYDAYNRAFYPDEREALMTEHLYCQNPDSYKYEGDGGYGTVADILCELYEPGQYALEAKNKEQEDTEE